MTKTAILIDGGFYKRIARKLWGECSYQERADELYQYATMHIADKRDAKIELGKRELYRIFYYDCPPVRSATVYHPLLKKGVNFSSNDEPFIWNDGLQRALGEKRKVALRFGQIMTGNAAYNLKPEVTKDLLSGKRTIDELKEDDFSVSFKQSGVDMRIGLDIASLSYAGIVDQIILVSGDVDFVPAAKMARRNGIDFILDSMGQHVRDDLKLHTDGIVTVIDDMNKAKRIK